MTPATKSNGRIVRTAAALVLAAVVTGTTWAGVPSAAHAQSVQSFVSARYHVNLPDATVSFEDATPRWYGGTLYTYKIAYDTGSAGIYFVGILHSAGATQQANGYSFSIAKKSFQSDGNVTSYHKNGVWLVQESGDAYCRVSEGVTRYHAIISVSVLDEEGCDDAYNKALAISKRLAGILP